MFIPTWGKWSNLTSIFFKGVGSTTNLLRYSMIFALKAYMGERSLRDQFKARHAINDCKVARMGGWWDAAWVIISGTLRLAGKSPSWIGNTSSNGGFSIAMLDYRSVHLLLGGRKTSKYLFGSFTPENWGGNLIQFGLAHIFFQMGCSTWNYQLALVCLRWCCIFLQIGKSSSNREKPLFSNHLKQKS